MRNILIGFIVGIFLISSFYLVSGEKVNSSVNVSYNSDLMRAFDDGGIVGDLTGQEDFIGLEVINNKVWANVIVELKDGSEVEVIGNKIERRELIKQKLKWFEPVIKDFVANLSESDFRNIRISSEGFGAWATKDGLEKIVNDSKVREIIWSQYKPRLAGNNIEISLIGQKVLFFLVLIFLFLVVAYTLIKIGKKYDK